MTKCEEEVYHKRMIWAYGRREHIWKSVLQNRKLMITNGVKCSNKAIFCINNKAIEQFMQWAREDADEKGYQL